MNRTTIVSAGILLGICFAPPPAAWAEDHGDAGAKGASLQAISGAKDKKEEAVLRKKLGDQYAAQEDYPRAADEFLAALSLAPSAFTRQERLQMAIAISWADRFDDAAAVLRAILAEDPEDLDARVQLAKVLSWANRLDEAAAEADTVLEEHPEDQDALLVKANTLRWRGDARASIPVYEKALAQGESFDVRLGLAFAYLDAGQKETAKALSAPLKPVYPYQQQELARFSDALCDAQTWRLGVSYSYYSDSDKNTVNRSALLYGYRAGGWDTELGYRFTDAKDPSRHERAEDLGITTQRKFGRFDTGAGVGVDRANDVSLVTGQARVNTDTAWGAVGVSAAREALTDTAQLIENRVARSSGTLNVTETASPRLSFNERYTYSGYSDGNNSQDLWLGAKYAVTTVLPKIAAGYRFRYWNFRRQTGSGYFDPEDFISNQVFLSFYTEKSGYYAYLEPYGGYQSYTRYGTNTGSTFFGFNGSAGWTMKKCTALEIYTEGSNYAGTVAGFNYFQVGFRLTAYF
jgi:tetratricopeptide (TPR) repeat protein